MGFRETPLPQAADYVRRLNSYDPTLLNQWDPEYDPNLASDPTFAIHAADNLKAKYPEIDWETLKSDRPKLLDTIWNIVNKPPPIDYAAIRNSPNPDREAIRQASIQRMGKGTPVSDPTSPWAMDTARVTAASEAYANRQRPEFHIQQTAVSQPIQQSSPVVTPAPAQIPQIQVPQQTQSTGNFGPQLPGQRQIYSWAGPQIKLPAEITDQLPETIVPSQSSQPTTFTPQAASTDPSSQQTFQPPKSVPIPDLAKLQSGEPSSNNLFATINGLQNRSTTTAPKTSGFYGGFY